MGHSMTQLIESVLSGSGEMRERMRAFDWSTTTLGPLERWPQSLRLSLRLVLASGYPMCILWAPDYTMLYNDAYRLLIGTKHPLALGRGAREVVPESWDWVEPIFERVMTQGEDFSTLDDHLTPLNRKNYLEECYFAFLYSPSRDDSGGVCGILATALEMTERVLEDRRRLVLRRSGVPNGRSASRG
jgi:hypothetical protein